MMNWKLGIAVVNVTPPVGVRLWGYSPRESTFVGHALRAEALACEAADGRGWLLISADIGAFSAPLALLVQSEIARRTGLPVEAILLTATHTHSGPHVTDALWSEQSALESTYFRTLQDKLVQVGEEAWRTRSTGELVYGKTTAPKDVAGNRRIQDENGKWVNCFSDPEGRSQGYYDPVIEMLGVRRSDGQLAALMVNFGCHPVCFGPAYTGISGDYVSYLKDALEEAQAAGTVLFTVSGHANIDPRYCGSDNPEVARRMGYQLADAVKGALADLKPVRGERAAAIREPWEFEANWELSGRMLIYFPFAAKGATVQTSISVLAAGNLALLGLPGETVSEYRETFARLGPFAHTLMISIANDFIGYLPTDSILKEGAYEAGMSPLRPMEAELTSRVEAALRKAADQCPPGFASARSKLM